MAVCQEGSGAGRLHPRWAHPGALPDGLTQPRGQTSSGPGPRSRARAHPIGHPTIPGEDQPVEKHTGHTEAQPDKDPRPSRRRGQRTLSLGRPGLLPATLPEHFVPQLREDRWQKAISVRGTKKTCMVLFAREQMSLNSNVGNKISSQNTFQVHATGLFVKACLEKGVTGSNPAPSLAPACGGPVSTVNWSREKSPRGRGRSFCEPPGSHCSVGHPLGNGPSGQPLTQH